MESESRFGIVAPPRKEPPTAENMYGRPLHDLTSWEELKLFIKQLFFDLHTLGDFGQVHLSLHTSDFPGVYMKDHQQVTQRRVAADHARIFKNTTHQRKRLRIL
jgi:hypothetical protein